ncbi:oxygen-independent coproporphyrinogen III oxidase [Hyphomicrobium sp. LHD-15]|uniref:oxygen-independent coproporphyrinogen III oxidase n=1 Tax=Hyphomicrobium sp. LHD-15 TaxID=3072142 RepID=UPI00280DE37F|nr:oxygen-independent coproporphyrinogen III oxidase [Hyphomicrobium sp. LHD-15]MDQ8700658.1 oxygen-independent coproporphyrinogen III oxidase [Hyphomicrobium sp. LHD-15]
MTPELIKRYAAPVPRYTSYPTANHFSAAITEEHYRGWLATLPADAALSLYVHIPYCRELCWYCGCSTKAVRRYQPVADYLAPLVGEIDAVGGLVPAGHCVRHVHWGGGSPDILSASDILRLGQALRARFTVAADGEFAVEIDPRLLREDQADSFAAVGVNRVSIGVQDFDEAVQRAIGRIQSFETTRRAAEIFRGRGVASINMDLVYGLPGQTEDSLARTLDQVLALQPDRAAVFGYAHLPDRLKHQRLIDETTLPGPVERFAQARLIARRLVEAGYVEIGIDHFARPEDSLAKAAPARNFQGYTTDKADALLGFGASAISRLPQGFAQNAVAVDDYTRRISGGELGTVRGHEMQGDDNLRAALIEQLMCGFAVSWRDLADQFGSSVERVRQEAEDCARGDEDAFVDISEEGIRITDRGKPFVRTICAVFDPYLSREVARRRHAIAV